MTGVEIDMIVTDSLAALALYETMFEIERIEVTDYPRGQNEAVFTLFGTRIHLLDENPDFQMFAPKAEDPKSMWLNVVVTDIRATYAKALEAGCTELQPVTELPEMGVCNALVADPFGYLWMLHEIVREVSFEARCKLMEQQMGLQEP